MFVVCLLYDRFLVCVGLMWFLLSGACYLLVLIVLVVLCFCMFDICGLCDDAFVFCVVVVCFVLFCCVYFFVRSIVCLRRFVFVV